MLINNRSQNYARLGIKGLNAPRVQCINMLSKHFWPCKCKCNHSIIFRHFYSNPEKTLSKQKNSRKYHIPVKILFPGGTSFQEFQISELIRIPNNADLWMEAAEKGAWDVANKRKLFVFRNRSENSPMSNVDICILFYLLFISCFFAS